jgi:hypothetical protein
VALWRGRGDPVDRYRVLAQGLQEFTSYYVERERRRPGEAVQVVVTKFAEEAAG